MNNNKIFFVVIIFFFIINLIIVHGTVIADNVYSLYPLEITGGEITASGEEAIIQVSKGAVIDAGELKIEADAVQIEMEKALILAEGEVRIQNRSRILKGSSFVYDYDKNDGILYFAEGDIDGINFQGLEINISEAEENINIKEAEITTCALKENPHYHLRAEKIIIYPGKKLEAQKASLFMGNVRLFTLPSYIVDYSDEMNGIFPLTTLSYDTDKGLVLQMSYHYQHGEKFKGSLTADMNQAGEQNYQMLNTYDLNNRFNLKNKIIYNEEDDSEEFLLQGGIEYNKNNLQIESMLVRDLLIGENILHNELNYEGENHDLNTVFKYNFASGERTEAFKINYTPYSLSTITVEQEYLNEELQKESYRIKQSLGTFLPETTMEITYRNGYALDYHPYLNIENKGQLPDIIAGGLVFNYKLGIGGGRVQHKGISTDKIHYEVGVDTKLLNNEQYNLNMKSGYIINNYFDENTHNYNIFELDLDGNYRWNLSHKAQLEAGLRYNLIKTSGTPVIASDNEDEKEIIQPMLEYKIYDDKKEAGWALGVDAEYELNEYKWQSVNLKAARVYDCYNYSFGYDPVNKKYSFGIDF